MLLELSAKKLRERLYTPNAELPEGVERPALKQVLINKCPVISPTSTLTGDAAKRLNIDIMHCQRNRQAVLAARREIQQKIAQIFEPREYEAKSDTDLMLYGGGFFSDSDKRQMTTIHNTPAEELAGQSWKFDDQRLPEMLFRYRARNFPETLSGDEQAQWLEHCRARLIEGEAGHFTFEAFYTELQEQRVEQELDQGKLQILNEVEEFVRDLERYLKG